MDAKLLDESLSRSSLSLGENEAPNGLISGLTGGLAFGARCETVF